MPWPRYQRADVVRAAEPQREGRHGERGVLVDERHERRDVVALEGVDVAGQQLGLLGVDLLGLAVVDLAGGEGRSGPLQRAVHGRDARLEQLGHLVGVPAQHLAQDEHRSLPRREVLERGDEREADRLAGGRQLGRIAVARHHTRVGDRLDPGVSRARPRRARCRPARRGRGPSAGPGAAGRAACRGRRWWRCGRATTAGRRGPRSRRCPSRPGPWSPARRPRPRSPSRASGSSTRSARGGGPRARAPGRRARAGCHRRRRDGWTRSTA